MPVYDYRCETTGEIFEVTHPMNLRLSTWQDLCDVSGMDMRDIPADTPVTKVLTTGGVVKSSTLKNPELPPCMTGGGCSGGSCGF